MKSRILGSLSQGLLLRSMYAPQLLLSLLSYLAGLAVALVAAVAPVAGYEQVLRNGARRATATALDYEQISRRSLGFNGFACIERATNRSLRGV